MPETVWVVTDRNGTFCGVFRSREAANKEIEYRHSDPWYNDFQPHGYEKQQVRD